MSEIPLPYPLKADDTIIFLHIPKTAGTTFNALLAKQFPWEEIRPFPSPNPQPVETPKQGMFPRRFSPSIKQAHLDFSPVNEQTGRPYRVILGHWDFRVVERYPGLVPITFLRHPLERLLSAYKHVTRVNDVWNKPMKERLQTIPLDQLANSEDMWGSFANQHTRQVAGKIWAPNGVKISREEMLAQAKANLERCIFVGLTEHYDESLLLLAHTFGWQPVLNYQSLNRAPEKNSIDQLDDRTQESLMPLIDLDMVLYEHGQRLYHQRFRQMIENLYGVPQDAANNGISGKPLFNPGLRQVIAQRIAADHAGRAAADPAHDSYQAGSIGQSPR